MRIRFANMVLSCLLVAGCGGGGGGGSPPPDPDPPAITFQQISADGGRVAWYKGGAHELIAFDAIVDDTTRDTDVFVMQPDGSNVRCVTCGSAIPRGFIGQPEWHPDGQHLIVQAENVNSTHQLFNHMAWGINQDLWIIGMDGSGAELIVDNAPYPQHGALHPHFNSDGTMVIFAERIATGEQITLPTITPGGENPWAGWQIHVAEFDILAPGTSKLFNDGVLFATFPVKDRGLFETHGFVSDSQIIYSQTAGGENYVDDIYVANLDGSSPMNLINSPSTWDEHGAYSPSGNSLVFISSRVDGSWQAPMDDATTLRTELFIERAGVIEQLSFFNSNGAPDRRYLTSDFEWDRDGDRIVVLVQPVDDATGAPLAAENWVISFPALQ